MQIITHLLQHEGVLCYLDMPSVNTGTAQNLKPLCYEGIDFSKCVAFMSDTTNTMRGPRPGVQKIPITLKRINTN